ncbi:nitroreductase family protein [Duganella violaceipulchra]|uniref:SagB-type dehydrogenase family enzyme n=1 Tax=Duganella violaceipulchra TaxID=2849652 RepID=A0AA41H9Q3_9BURK|nr:SagB/ThcOx family dehydrogenase [Duganella violaceicalia]MBV6323325.1 SagB/ThcOx family dehydrogenase [Duganella violaceicalia]MCP2007724.1 SagB-type dehydrogenase family enzyme [Duganella violaceicalia]
MSAASHGGLPALQLIAPEALALDAEFSPLSMALFKVLLRRQSSRAFGADELPLYALSRLLWAAFGINRPDLGLRTAPSANNGQEIDIYVAMRAGLYRFDAQQLALLPVLAEDVRAATGGQDFVAGAPLNLIYVASLKDDSTRPEEEQKFYAALDTGFISQNVYLFCAAEGLATVVRGWVDRPALAAVMGLAPHQHVVAAQTVGYPPQREPARQ